MRFFDYIYYRITRLYLKRDGKNSIRAIVIISVMQALILFDISILIIKFYHEWSEISEFSKTAGKIGAGLTILLIILNYRRYQEKYDDYNFCWGNENTLRKWGFGLFIIIALGLPFLIVAYI